MKTSVITFQNLTPTSCEVKDGAAPSGTLNQVYRIPDKISTWQVISFSEMLGDFMDASSDAGAALVNAILAITQTGDVKLAAQSIRDYDGANPDKAGFGMMMTKGFRDVLKYVSKNDLLPRLMGTLFLKPGELAVENMDERIALFRQAPIALLGGAVKDFLGKKMGQWKSTPSGSKIFETLTNYLSQKKETTPSAETIPAQNSESVGTADSSTSLPTET